MSRIRLVQPDDAGALAEILVRSRDFLAPWEPLRDDHYFTPAGQSELIEASLARLEQGAMRPMVILDDAGDVAGRINLNSIVRGPFQSATVGYWLDQAATGRGFATQAVAELIEVAFGEERLHRLEAGTIPENRRSQAVLERNGFARFGYAPRYLAIAGRWCDHLLFQCVAPD